MKKKIDFYISFYEQLALKGFRAYEPAYDHDKQYLADICVNGTNIAHLTQEDTIIANPYIEVDDKMIEKIHDIAKTTAISWGCCAEKPYDEDIHNELMDGSYKIGEFNEVLLVAQEHPLFGYTFATFDRAKSERGEDDGYTIYYNMNDGMRGFAVHSGLIDERQLFSENELTAIHDGLSNFVMTPDNNLDFEAGQAVDGIIDKIENLIPSITGRDISSEIYNEADLSEGVEV